MDISSLALQATQLLAKLIETPRTSRNEGAAADLLMDYMQRVLQLQVCREVHNLWAIAPNFSPSRPTLLLNAHIDTVRPSDAWTRDPFCAKWWGDRLYGLGSNDDGASLVCLLHVFAQLATRPQAYNLVFLASAEEEISGENGIVRAIPLLPKIDMALVGEPTGMQPAVAEKGLMVVDFTAHGQAGHAARNEGDNAIYHAIDDINWLRHHKWERVSPLLGAVKMSVTIVQGGTQHNVVPDRCTFTADIRSNELYTNEALFEAITQNVKSEAKAHSFRLGSSSIAMDHPLVRQAIAIGGKPFGSPTLSDQALMPWPSMKMGPGESRRSHTADEFICLSEIKQGIARYLQLLDGIEI